MPGAYLWGWNPDNTEWTKLRVDTDGSIHFVGHVDKLDDIGNVDVPSPSDGQGLYWDNAAGKWQAKGFGDMYKATYDPDEDGVIAADQIANLDTSKITSGRFPMPRMPDGTDGYLLTAKGAGVDPAYNAPAGNVPAWELIDSYEDTDTGTAFDYDSGVVTVYDEYMIILQVEDFSGALNTGRVRVNGDSSANYTRTNFTGGSTTGKTSFEYTPNVPANEVGMGVIHIKGTFVSTPTNNYPLICAHATELTEGTPNGHGRLQVGYSNVDQVRTWMGGASTGRLKLYGLNY